MSTVTRLQGMYGPADTLFLVDGYNALSNKPDSLKYMVESLTEDAVGSLGSASMGATPIGVSRVTLEVPILRSERTALTRGAAICAALGAAMLIAGYVLPATAALIAHPDFPLVARASPAWVRAALTTITALEADLDSK